ncbi:DUF6193 family natural product biosynthesis protein [Streptomyces smaragdinus]|nr:DUF6193 family natural product biosynthesis protein [Streptomyces smaragdinus]
MAEARKRGPAAAVDACWENLLLHWHWRHAANEALRPGRPVPPLIPLVTAAAAEPRLRRLYPYTSHYFLRFSSTTHYPYANQGGMIEPLINGNFRVHRRDPHADLGEFTTAEEAVARVVRLLPDTDPEVTAGRDEPTSGA